jgi:hypothetical protein
VEFLLKTVTEPITDIFQKTIFTLKNSTAQKKNGNGSSIAKHVLAFIATYANFFRRKKQFSAEGSDWKNITAKISEHENSSDHKQSMCTFSMRLKAKGRIDSKIVEQKETEREYWRQVLKRIVATVKFLSAQGLSFRGHGKNQGNYVTCLEYLAEFDSYLENHLKKYANKGQGFVNYLSNTICDEFIQIMGTNLRDQFINEVKQATYFSLIVDSTPDVSHLDQLTIILRYVLPDGLIKESFFAFIHIYAHNAESFEHVVENFEKWGIDIRKCRGQSYDNASNMSGKYSGLQARIKILSPNAEYIPCLSHSLNLVGNAAAESSSVATSYFDFVQNLYAWFSASTQRWDVLKSTIEKNACTVKIVSATRWSARADAVFALYKSYDRIKTALMQVGEDPNQKPIVKIEAKALVKKMDLYETALITVLWNKLLQRINATSKSLQNPELCLSSGIRLLESLKDFVTEVRDDFGSNENEASLLDAGNCNYQDEHRLIKKKAKQCLMRKCGCFTRTR